MKEVEIKTKRMTLRPTSGEEIEALMERTDSDDLRAGLQGKCWTAANAIRRTGSGTRRGK